MNWPRWRKQVKEQKRGIERSEARREAIEQNWDFIRDQVRQARRHRTQNHITQLIIGVARGDK
jgi:hypothetical protein